MLDIEMVRSSTFAVIRAAGTLQSADELDTFARALEFVPDDEDLVIDFSELELLTSECVSVLRRHLQQRVIWSEAVVVSSNDDVTLQLLLGEVARVVTVLPGLEQAADVIRSRRSAATAEVSP